MGGLLGAAGEGGMSISVENSHAFSYVFFFRLGGVHSL